MKPAAGLVALLAVALGVAPLAEAAPARAPAPAPPPAKPWDLDPIRSTYQAPRSGPVLIRGATVLDGRGARLDNADVLMRDGRIVAVGPNLARGDATEIDGRGRWVTPGIIDPHSHDGTYVLPLSEIDGYASDVSEGSSVNNADTWIDTAINPQDVAFSRALRSGVTTLQILPGSGAIFGGHAVIVKPVPAVTVAAMKMPGAPVGFKMACGENPKSTGGEAVEHKDWPTSRQGVYEYMRAAFGKARAALAGWRAGHQPAVDPKTAALEGILAGDLRLQFHCYRASDMAAMLALADEFGFRITAFHHATESYRVVDLLKAHGTCSVVWSDWWGYKLEASDAIRANAAILSRAGACVTMHSDSPAVGQWLNLEAAKAGAAGRKLGIAIPPEQLITWITSGPARVIGLADRIGALAPGMDADVVLWSGNPFSVYSRPEKVFIAGATMFDRADPSVQPVPDFEVGRPAYQPVDQEVSQ